MDPSSAAARVLFVCMGNICRSPAAEATLRQWLEDQGLEEEIAVDSAGTISHHEGNPPDPRMRRAGEGRGLPIGGQARQVKAQDLEAFDLVIALDRENLADLEALAGGPRPHLRLLSSYLPEGSPLDVPDPYWGGEQGFEEVLDMLEGAIPAIAEELLNLARDDGRSSSPSRQPLPR